MQYAPALMEPPRAPLDTRSENESNGWRIYLATTPPEIDKLRPFWLKVNRHPDVDPDFYSLINSARKEVLSPFVVVAAKDDQPRAMLVGRLEAAKIPVKIGYCALGAFNARQLAFLPEGFLGDCTPAMARTMILRITESLNEALADRVILVNADTASELYRTARALPSIWLRDHSAQPAENWRTKLGCSMDEFLKRRSKRSRQHFRHIVRVFEEHFRGQVRYEVYQTREQIEGFCENAEQVARTTYQRGLGSGFFDNMENRQRLELSAEKGWLRAFMVFVRGEPLGFWCGRLYNDVMYLDWTGYRPSYREWEVGTIVFLKMVEHLCDAGVSEMDYGSGTAFYKERFGDEKREGASTCIHAPSVKGFTMNSFRTLEAGTNAGAKWVARKTGILDAIKRRWRRRLTEEPPSNR